MPLPRVYLANQFGFHDLGRRLLDETVIPAVRALDLHVIDPFREADAKIDFARLPALAAHEERMAFWRSAVETIGATNAALIREADAMLVLLDGGHAIDDGAAAEIGYCAALGGRPIFAWRSDLRLCESPASGVNAMLRRFVAESGGELTEGPGTFDAWLAAIRTWRTRFRS